MGRVTMEAIARNRAAELAAGDVVVEPKQKVVAPKKPAAKKKPKAKRSR